MSCLVAAKTINVKDFSYLTKAVTFRKIADNSTFTEPRWYNFDSVFYYTNLTDREFIKEWENMPS